MSGSAGPGEATVERRAVADPAAEATSIAGELGAEVAADPATAERLVRARVEAGRETLGDDGTDASLLARAEAIRAAATEPPPLGDDEVEELRDLAEDVIRAGRIRERTEARFAETLEAKVAASSGIALHPSAVLAAAAAVREAEDALRDARRRIDDLGPEPPSAAAAGERDHDGPAEPAAGAAVSDEAATAAGVVVAEVPDELPEDDEEEHGAETHHADVRDDDEYDDEYDDDFYDYDDFERRGSGRIQAVAYVLTFAGIGLVIQALKGPLWVAILVGVLGVLLGVLALVTGRRASAGHHRDVLDDLDDRHDEHDEPDEHDEAGDDVPGHGAEEGPAGAAASTEPPPGAAPPVDGPRAGPDLERDHARATWLEERLALDAARDEAEERVRVARARWHQLAGPDADPRDPEGAVQAHDPQLTYTGKAAETSPTVRTVATFHRKALARWKVRWAAAGVDTAPEPEELDATLEELLGPFRRAQEDAERLDAAEARRAALEVVRRPLVLVEPSRWWEPGRLEQLLGSVPPEGHVVVLERETGAGEDAGAETDPS